MFISIGLYADSEIHTTNTAVTGRIYFTGPTLRTSDWSSKKALMNIDDAMKTSFLFTESKAEMPAWWPFVWGEWRGILTNCEENRSSFCLLMQSILCLEGQRERKLCYPALSFIHQTGWGFCISVTTLISMNVHTSALWKKLQRYAYYLSILQSPCPVQ